MRRLILLAVLCCSVSPSSSHAGCADAAGNGDLCSRYSRRVLREESMATARNYVKKAEEAANAATDIADECDYEEAAGWFYRAARHAGSALKGNDLDATKQQAREMMRCCEEGIRAAEESR